MFIIITITTITIATTITTTTMMMMMMVIIMIMIMIIIIIIFILNSIICIEFFYTELSWQFKTFYIVKFHRFSLPLMIFRSNNGSSRLDKYIKSAGIHLITH